MTDDPLNRVRGVCLSLPEVTETAWETIPRPIFRVRDKAFVYYMDNHHNDGRLALWLKAGPGVQAALVGSDPDRFFAPPYVGPKGWIGVRLDRSVDWEEVADLVRDSYRLMAPKRLVALLDEC
jgi:predicted DNA-binding protein (MmcQ/YjbR family)